MSNIFIKFIPYLFGGLGGAMFNAIYNRVKYKIQFMDCYYIEEDVISKIPTIIENGEVHNNIYSKQFVLKNTTNADYKIFKIIFEFDKYSKIISHSETSKIGVNRLSKKLLQQNEYSATIKNFNRGDEIIFIFQISNILENKINVTEDSCTGFKIRLVDKRKSKGKQKINHVKKDQLK